jgi:hypothetical protein
MTAISIIPASAISVKEPVQATGTDPTAKNDGDAFGFDDFLDVINPLQHLPGVGMLYRAITGDRMEPPAELAGGALYGGVYGFLGALGSIAFQEITGDSIEQSVMSLFGGSDGEKLLLAQRAYGATQTLGDNDIERSPYPAPALPAHSAVAAL